MKTYWLDKELAVRIVAENTNDAFVIGRLAGILRLQKDKFNGYCECVCVTVPISAFVNAVLQ